MDLPKKKVDLPGLQGKHHITADGKEIRIGGHVFKRTVLPRPSSIRQEDEAIAELDTVDQKVIQELNNEQE